MVLQVKNLSTTFFTDKGQIKAVDGVNLDIKKGGIYGLVGESGCGKSMTLLSLLRLVPRTGKITSGEITFKDKDILKMSKRQIIAFRGKEMAMIFQDALTTLNPVFPVGEQIRESLRIHKMIEVSSSPLPWRKGRHLMRDEKKKVLSLMEEVGISSAMDRYMDYPHQFSGGMQQRIMIAIALSCNPKVLLADEPTTALDVTIQAQILNLMLKINREHGMAIILVTHDLGVTAEFCHHISVMYAGKIVEQGKTDDIIENPYHPYTKGLLSSIPKITKERKPIKPIPGNVPSLLNLPSGCAFRNRCSMAKEACKEPQAMREVEPGRLVRCNLYNGAREVG